MTSSARILQHFVTLIALSCPNWTEIGGRKRVLAEEMGGGAASSFLVPRRSITDFKSWAWGGDRRHWKRTQEVQGSLGYRPGCRVATSRAI